MTLLQVYNGVANFFISVFVSYLLYVTCESPFIALEKILFSKTLEQLKGPTVSPVTLKIDHPSGPKIAYTNEQIVEFIGPMIDKTTGLLDRQIIDTKKTSGRACQAFRASKSNWDNSVHSKSFVYVERL